MRFSQWSFRPAVLFEGGVQSDFVVVALKTDAVSKNSANIKTFVRKKDAYHINNKKAAPRNHITLAIQF
jgi:hypothetical protein